MRWVALVAQSVERAEPSQRSDALFRLHVLRLVKDEDGAGRLDEMNRGLALQAVGRLANDIQLLIEGVDSHHHELGAVGEGKLAHL